MLRLVVVLLLLCPFVADVKAQQPAPASAPALSVYLDCEWNGCDFDFFRTELTMVNWVRDRQVADVHILVTVETTGAGGREYSVNFLGMRRFTGVSDTLKYIASPTATEDDRRKGLARVFRFGLVRYLARTPAAEKLTISYAGGTESSQSKPSSDPWNQWVFSTSLQGYSSGEKTFKYYNMWGNFNADRITEKWKTRFNVNESYDESQNTYPICDAASVCKDTTYKYYQRSYGASALQVRALTQHWSAGMRGSISSSTYDNYRRVVRIFPAIEYNVFPYSQSTRRQLRGEYNIGWSQFSYNDTTIFDKIEEGMPIQRLSVTISTREPWGSIEIGSGLTSYLNDLSKYRVGTFSEFSVRLFKGFSLNAYGSYTMIRDQFTLPKKDFTPEEILTRQFQRGTGYRYWGNVGVRYTFGSIFNNVVNPRMSGGFFD
jgi:hypothetical protein